MQMMKARVGFGQLEYLFITHLHGDHVTGIPGLLMTLGQSSRDRPLTICGPAGIRGYLLATLAGLGIHLHYELIIQEIGSGIIVENKKYRIEAAPGDHTTSTLAYALIEANRPGRFDVDKARAQHVPEGPLFGELQAGRNVTLEDGRNVASTDVMGPPRSGRKVVLAIDTRPCPAVQNLACGADLLIHDGMFSEEMREEANERGHSTTRQAAEIARQAGAASLLLTHISPRYENTEGLLEEARTVFPSTQMAQDLMALDIPFHT
jgi:ribonuclease Z